FGRTLARQLRELGMDELLEVGAGSGALAEILVQEGPFKYSILETSADLAQRQRERLGDRVRWLQALPARFSGIVIANEVVDAMPVHAVAWRAHGLMERGVGLNEGQLAWSEVAAGGAVLESMSTLSLSPPYESEIGLAGQAWLRTLAERL